MGGPGNHVLPPKPQYLVVGRPRDTRCWGYYSTVVTPRQLSSGRRRCSGGRPECVIRPWPSPGRNTIPAHGVPAESPRPGWVRPSTRVTGPPTPPVGGREGKVRPRDTGSTLLKGCDANSDSHYPGPL